MARRGYPHPTSNLNRRSDDVVGTTFPPVWGHQPTGAATNPHPGLSLDLGRQGERQCGRDRAITAVSFDQYAPGRLALAEVITGSSGGDEAVVRFYALLGNYRRAAATNEHSVGTSAATAASLIRLPIVRPPPKGHNAGGGSVAGRSGRRVIGNLVELTPYRRLVEEPRAPVPAPSYESQPRLLRTAQRRYGAVLMEDRVSPSRCYGSWGAADYMGTNKLPGSGRRRRLPYPISVAAEPLTVLFHPGETSAPAPGRRRDLRTLSPRGPRLVSRYLRLVDSCEPAHTGDR